MGVDWSFITSSSILALKIWCQMTTKALLGNDFPILASAAFIYWPLQRQFAPPSHPFFLTRSDTPTSLKSIKGFSPIFLLLLLFNNSFGCWQLWSIGHFCIQVWKIHILFFQISLFSLLGDFFNSIQFSLIFCLQPTIFYLFYLNFLTVLANSNLSLPTKIAFCPKESLDF